MAAGRQAFETPGPVGVVAGWRMETTSSDPGHPVVLLHGVNSSADDWCEVASRLVASRSVIAFDLRGHGESARSGPYTLNGYAEDVAAVMDALDVDRAHVAGTSFGGATALAFAAANPDRVASAATLGMPLGDDPEVLELITKGLESLGVRGFFEYVIPRYDFGPDADPAQVAAAVNVASSNDLATVEQILRAAFTTDLEPVATAVQRPVLVAVGEHDLSCPLEGVQALARVVGSPIVVVPAATHAAHIEQPAAIADLIEAHLQAHDSGAAG